MTVAALRRLPGFAFEAQVPVYDDVLPRMDVAVFIGFAASGPLNIPVPVEDPARFAEVFGGDVPLAWDDATATQTVAQLAPAVRMFFANGGRRCWVVRVAAEPVTNEFGVPGIATFDRQSKLLAPLTLRARSPGSWSDDVRLSASLTSQRMEVVSWTAGGCVLESPDATLVRPGDLLHVAWPPPDDDIEGWVGIASAELTNDRLGHPNRQRITLGDAAWFEPISDAPDGTYSIELPPGTTVQVGQVFARKVGGRQLVLAVSDPGEQDDEPGSASPPSMRIVRGRALWQLPAMPVSSPGPLPVVRRIGLDLWTRIGEGQPRRVGGLGLAPSNPRHVALLPSDTDVFTADEANMGAGDALDLDLWGDVVAPRCPVAGDGAPVLCIPFGIAVLPELFLRTVPPDMAALKRDGLDVFDTSLFADPKLVESFSTTLITDAEFERFGSASLLTDPPRPPRRLAGIHAALSVDEATIIAVPDAVHRGWELVDYPAPVEPPVPAVKARKPCPTDDFDDCPHAAAADDECITSPPKMDDRRVVTNKPVVPASRWHVRPEKQYRDTVLMDVHRLLLRFCAARRDALAVLSLPEHYDEDAAAAHARLLALPAFQAPVNNESKVPPLGTGESDALGFAALYHVWPFTRDASGALRSQSPDGVACGVIARRAAERGAWVAPANELLRGVLALNRIVPKSRLLDLLQRDINVVRQDPRGFVLMSADTLASDDDVRPISVRRLLILLRRVALRRGAQYVFEPNDDSFRRMVQRGFEETLGELFQRGAFAGDTPAAAFQVVTGESLNTPQSRDVGRFIVELRVAPSRPMAFLTLRLVQAGERLSLVGA